MARGVLTLPSRTEGQHSKHQHLKPQLGLWRQGQLLVCLGCQLVVQLDHFGRHRILPRLPERESQRLLMKGSLQHFDEAQPIGRDLSHSVHPVQCGLSVAGCNGSNEVMNTFLPLDTQHLLNGGRLHLTVGKGNGLIRQRQGISDASSGRSADRIECLGFKTQTFLSEDVCQMLSNPIRWQISKPKLQTTRQYRHRHFLWIRGSQNEFHVRWRFFKRFQQRIEAVPRQHMNFVNQINLEATLARRVLNVFQQLTGVLDLGSAGRVHFDQVNKSTCLNRLASTTG